MLTSISLKNFKNFADETLRLGPFTIIVGANASGKSNIRDAFRFLHGVGRGYTLAEIIGGKYGVGGQIEWAGIRGATDEIVRFGQSAFTIQAAKGTRKKPGVPFSIPLDRYSITVGCDDPNSGLFQVVAEELRNIKRETYTSHPGSGDPVHDQDDDTHLLLRMGKTGEQRKYGNRIMVRPNQPALTQIHEHRRVVKSQRDHAEQIIRIFSSMRFLDLEPNRMRQAAFPGQTVLGDGGENLPTVLREICADPERRETLVEWTRELTPMDVRDFEFPTDPTTGRVQIVFREANDRRVSAYGASDGTLRFLALLAALLGKNPAQLYFFEEIENGIHPTRMRLLIELIERQTARGESQVVTTTHSPELLTLVNDDTFDNTSVVYRDENSDDGIVRPLTELPNAAELRRSQGLGRLHTSGWMEDMLAFTAGGEDGQGTRE